MSCFHSNCPRTCTFKVYDEDTEDWVDYAAGTAPYATTDIYTEHPWVHSISTDGLCTLQLELLNANTFWTTAMAENRKEWRVSMTMEVPLANAAQIEDFWTV